MLLLIFAALAAAAALLFWLAGVPAWTGPSLIVALALLAVYAHRRETTRGYAFSVDVFGFVAASMFYPQVFIRVGDFELKRLIVPLIQVIMFGMGTGLNIADFTRVFRVPKPVFICMILQFTIMPITGFVLAKLFALDCVCLPA